MKAQLECFSCNIRQAQEAALLAGAPKNLVWCISQEVCKLFASADPEWTPAYMTSLAHQVAKTMTGVGDIYREEKRKYNQIALQLYPRLKAFVEEGPPEERLERAVKVAIAGNIIDLGVYREVSPEKILAQITDEGWGRCHLEAFLEDLEEAESIFYAADNAGEVVFDRVFLEEITPAKKVFFVVKGGPMSNDATLFDAQEAGLGSIVKIITTGRAEIGIDLEKALPEVQKAWEEADLVISKGQANFESLSSWRRDRVYFLLKAKCVPVARELEVPQGALVLQRGLQKTPQPV